MGDDALEIYDLDGARRLIRRYTAIPAHERLARIRGRGEMDDLPFRNSGLAGRPACDPVRLTRDRAEARLRNCNAGWVPLARGSAYSGDGGQRCDCPYAECENSETPARLRAGCTPDTCPR